MMHTRRNGHVFTSKEAFIPRPGFFTIVVDGSPDISVKDTGVVFPLVEFKRQYHKILFDPQNGTMKDIDQLPAEYRTFNDVEVTNDADYVSKYYAQLNLNRIIDIVAQRNVIIAISELNDGDGAVVDSSIVWSSTGSDHTLSGDANVFTFIGEKYDAFKNEYATEFGVPNEGENYQLDNALIDVIKELDIYKNDGTVAAYSEIGVALTVGAIVGGSGYTTSQSNVDLGNGLIVDYTSDGDAITAVTIVQGGSGFTAGQVVNIPGGNDDATVEIATVSSSELVTCVGVFDSFKPILK